MKTIRCAIYTRKSNEEGLEQAFNSLDAQRQAGIDYIKSQKHEGWSIIKTHYDDGGFSGGTMKRPALEQLIEDIECGRIDVIVVYKVDRLSRSLTDFARMVQVFDEHKVSFVSVTQQFNTTNSMGRLTLNMLLSFAQFEREVTGERIRDKIAATKKKGYWVSGQPPLGYRVQREEEARGIYIIPKEADLARRIFELYLKTESHIQTAQQLNEEGHTTKHWISSKGNWHGGRPLTQKYIYKVLTNPVYLGKITHTRNEVTEIYDGLHKPIVEQSLWDQVHRIIKSQDRKNRHRWLHQYLLKGKIRTHDDFAMSPSSVHRPLTKRNDSGQKRLVRYYISQKAIKRGFKACLIKSINANHLDDLARGIVLDYLSHKPLEKQSSETRDHWIREVIESVTLAPDKLTLRLNCDAIERLRVHELLPTGNECQPYPTCAYKPEIEDRGRLVNLTLDVQIKKLDGRRMILSPDGKDLVFPSVPAPKQHIVDAIGLAYRWHHEIMETKLSLRDYADQNHISRTRLLNLLPLTYLSPEILRHALVGTLAPSITLSDLLRATEQLDWNHQAQSIGLDRAKIAAVSA
ncbi:MAG: recombinase family protein [Phycisphaerales bacterium]|nr:recombinase family protein [Phycisphaerales bacterium]